MTEWSPQDVTLFVSATLSGLAAIFGVAVPAIVRIKEGRAAVNRDRFSELQNSVFFCVENVGRFQTYQSSFQIRAAMLRAERFVESEPEEIKLIDDFKGHANLVRVICSEIGVDDSKFQVCVSKIEATDLDYEVFEGKLRAGEGNKEAAASVVLCSNSLVDEAVKIIRKARSMFKQ